MGDNHAGQLGISPAESRKKTNPILVEGLQQGFKVQSVHCAGDNSFALVSGTTKEHSVLYSWGSQKTGLLGKDVETMSEPFHQPTQVLFDGEGQVKVKQFSTGYDHVALLTKDNGSLFLWGDNSKGQLGLNNLTTQGQPHQNSLVWPTQIE